MAFQGALAAQDGTPGIPAVAATATTDINQLVHIIQAQQPAQQVHQQQMATMLNHLVTTQNANLPPIGVTGTGAVRNIDERPFRRIPQFDNKSESWKEWRAHFLTAVRESSPLRPRSWKWLSSTRCRCSRRKSSRQTLFTKKRRICDTRCIRDCFPSPLAYPSL